MDEINRLSDKQLRKKLIDLNISVGPITPSTRKMYEKKLLAREMEGANTSRSFKNTSRKSSKTSRNVGSESFHSRAETYRVGNFNKTIDTNENDSSEDESSLEESNEELFKSKPKYKSNDSKSGMYDDHHDVGMIPKTIPEKKLYYDANRTPSNELYSTPITQNPRELMRDGFFYKNVDSPGHTPFVSKRSLKNEIPRRSIDTTDNSLVSDISTIFAPERSFQSNVSVINNGRVKERRGIDSDSNSSDLTDIKKQRIFSKICNPKLLLLGILFVAILLLVLNYHFNNTYSISRKTFQNANLKACVLGYLYKNSVSIGCKKMGECFATDYIDTCPELLVSVSKIHKTCQNVLSYEYRPIGKFISMLRNVIRDGQLTCFNEFKEKINCDDNLVYFSQQIEPYLLRLCYFKDLLNTIKSPLIILLSLIIAFYFCRRYWNRVFYHQNTIDLKNKALSIMVNHHKDFLNEACSESSLPVIHIRDSLIPKSQLKKMLKYWNCAVKLLEKSAVKKSVSRMNGICIDMWTLQPSYINSKVDYDALMSCYIKRFFPSLSFISDLKSLRRKQLSVAPSRFLKLSNCHRGRMEWHHDWLNMTREALIEICELMNTHVFHVFVDEFSKSGSVYIKFYSQQSALEAFNIFNNIWFDGNQIEAKFLKKEEYLRKHPEASLSQCRLKKSNEYHSCIV